MPSMAGSRSGVRSCGVWTRWTCQMPRAGCSREVEVVVAAAAARRPRVSPILHRTSHRRASGRLMRIGPLGPPARLTSRRSRGCCRRPRPQASLRRYRRVPRRGAAVQRPRPNLLPPRCPRRHRPPPGAPKQRAAEGRRSRWRSAARRGNGRGRSSRRRPVPLPSPRTSLRPTSRAHAAPVALGPPRPSSSLMASQGAALMVPPGNESLG